VTQESKSDLMPCHVLLLTKVTEMPGHVSYIMPGYKITFCFLLFVTGSGNDMSCSLIY
jgi:hypothetical protein